MRQILFRGRRVDNGEWVEGGSIIRSGCNSFCAILPSETDLKISTIVKEIICTPVQIAPETLMFKYNCSEWEVVDI